MSTKELAFNILEQLTEEQLQAFVTLFGKQHQDFPESEPDEWDKAMIKNSKDDNNTSMSLDDFAKELGFNPDDLRI